MRLRGISWWEWWWLIPVVSVLLPFMWGEGWMERWRKRNDRPLDR